MEFNQIFSYAATIFFIIFFIIFYLKMRASWRKDQQKREAERPAIERRARIQFLSNVLQTNTPGVGPLNWGKMKQELTELLEEEGYRSE